MASDNREEHCYRIGGPVYMRDGKKCPECGVLETHQTKADLRERVAKLEAESCDQSELIAEFQSAAGINVGGDPSGVTPDHVRSEIAMILRSAAVFSPDDLRRIIKRVSLRPRNGQDIVIEAKCRALATDHEEKT